MADSFHWADITADKIIREKGDKDLYVCASGITPSGTVHIGNFREIISVALTVQALREKGKNVRFLYSWDDYDVFRKVPKNMPQQELLESYLRQPITLVPDVYGQYESYAQYNEKTLEKRLDEKDKKRKERKHAGQNTFTGKLWHSGRSRYKICGICTGLSSEMCLLPQP